MDGAATLDLIKSRRSIRRGYQATPVPMAVLEDVVASGLAAPSSKNAQPWRFHVVTSREQLNDLADAIAGSDAIDDYVPWDPRTHQPYPQYQSTVVGSADVLRQVPAAIFVENLGAFSGGRATLAASGEGLRDSLEGYGFELIGIGAAVENMWLAALALGLSAVFMGDVVIAEESIRRHLGLSGDLAGVLAMGYSEAGPLIPMDKPALSAEPRVVWH